MSLILDVAPLSGGVGVFAVVAFFLVFMVVAFVVFRLLKRTVKMAVRLTIVAVIMAVAVAGSVALWALGSGKSERPRPTRSR
jgi:hypothetical protein